MDRGSLYGRPPRSTWVTLIYRRWREGSIYGSAVGTSPLMARLHMDRKPPYQLVKEPSRLVRRQGA